MFGNSQCSVSAGPRRGIVRLFDAQVSERKGGESDCDGPRRENHQWGGSGCACRRLLSLIQCPFSVFSHPRAASSRLRRRKRGRADRCGRSRSRRTHPVQAEVSETLFTGILSAGGFYMQRSNLWLQERHGTLVGASSALRQRQWVTCEGGDGSNQRRGVSRLALASGKWFEGKRINFTGYCYAATFF